MDGQINDFIVIVVSFMNCHYLLLSFSKKIIMISSFKSSFIWHLLAISWDYATLLHPSIRSLLCLSILDA